MYKFYIQYLQIRNNIVSLGFPILVCTERISHVLEMYEEKDKLDINFFATFFFFSVSDCLRQSHDRRNSDIKYHTGYIKIIFTILLRNKTQTTKKKITR